MRNVRLQNAVSFVLFSEKNTYFVFSDTILTVLLSMASIIKFADGVHQDRTAQNLLSDLSSTPSATYGESPIKSKR